MEKFIYKFALTLAVITFVTCILGSITLFTAFIRSVEVYLGVLFLFYIGGQILKLGVAVMEQKSPEPEEDNK